MYASAVPVTIEPEPPEQDREAIVAALAAGGGEALDGWSQAALAEWRGRELYPGPAAGTRQELLDYVRRTAITYHHQVGTCKMGTDAASVVDPRLRVHGLDGLRVADASIMPMVTTGNTNAPSIMIGERAAEFLLADA